MRRIILVSDTHMRPKILERVIELYPAVDEYLMCGDSSLPKKEIFNFESVQGNHDYVNYPKEIIKDIEGNKILMTHGHFQCIWPEHIEDLISYAKGLKVDLVFYGHTHIYMDEVIDGIRFINPGSLFFNRDMSDPSFAYIEIDGKNVTVKKETIPYSENEIERMY